MSPAFFKRRNRLVERRKAAQSGGASRRDAMVGLFLAFLLWFSALVMIYSGGSGSQTGLAEGQRAPVTVVAAADFTCVDIPKTEINRLQAEKSVPPVFAINYGLQNTALRALDKLFERLIEVRETTDTRQARRDAEEEIGKALDLLGVPLTAAEALQLAPKGSEEAVRDAIIAALRKTWAAGILSPEERASQFQGAAATGTIIIRRPDGSFEGPLSIANLATPEAALDICVTNVVAQLEGVRLQRAPLTGLLKPWIAPNLLYDPHLTADRRHAAREEVAPATMTVRSGTTIVEGGERLTAQKLAMLTAHERRLSQLESPHDRLIRRIGSAGLLLAALIACIGLIQILAPDVIGKESRLLLLIVLSLIVILPSRGLMHLSYVPQAFPPAVVQFALPLALAPVLASILLGNTIALPIGLWVSFAVAVLFDNNFTILTLGLVVTVVAALSTRHVRKRSQIYRAGVFIGLAKVLYAISLGAIRQQPAQVVFMQSLAGVGSGIAGAFVAALLLPILEWIFRITTDITLLELSDMSHPLLQRLAMEAPGTYHHSIVVANLGEAAATRIGANSLIVRVGAYFHDVGKLAKPEYFAENMNLRENPHDGLAPTMSALIITSHVKEGTALGRRHKLPRCILDAVEQHHGTGVTSYFYHMAKQQAEQGNASRAGARGVNEEDFRYEGPKPMTREMGILMLADSVEAAARSLEKPNPVRITNLVNDIVNGKIRDGQLDSCRLTLADLSAVKQSFVSTLGNMLHVRIAYPQDEADTAQPTEKAAAPADSRPATDTVAGRPGTEPGTSAVG